MMVKVVIHLFFVIYMTICQVQGDIQVYLVNGNGPNSGRVEIVINGLNGTICDDRWSNKNAAVVCRMLGFRGGQATIRATFGEGSGVIWLDDVEYNGDESSLFDCSRRPWGNHNCDHSEDAGVICEDAVDATSRKSTTTQSTLQTPTVRIRLVDGGVTSRGRIKMWYNGRSGTVCDDNFDDNDANVVCRMVGYSGSKPSKLYGPGEGTIWLGSLSCHGNESSIHDCQHDGWGVSDCTHKEDAGVDCEDESVYFSAMNCKNTRKGLEYRGTTSVTRSGRTCQRWDSQYPHYHAFYILPSSNENFCRNPDSDSRPWCYTTDPQKRWEYCDVPVCVKNCKWDTQGLQYRGKTNVTKSGRKCQRWDSQYPHGHSDTDRLPGNASLNENFCRNPDRDSSPWCYTTDPLKRWEYCDVPVCDDTSNNDIALLKVKPNKRGRGISMGSYVQHACLPSEDTVYSENLDCYISGWGSLKNGISPHLLKYAQIPIANQTICKELYKLKGYNITESMFCAGYFNGGSDTCDGDSGGPLVCKVNGKYTVLGVTSWGHRCGLPNFPEVYGNVKSLLQWIRETHAAYYSLNLRTFSNPVCYICTVTSVDY